MCIRDRDGDEAVKAICAWAEATEPTEAELGAGEEDHRKLYFGRTQNKSLAVTNRRSIVIYGDQDEEYPDAAYVGNVGPVSYTHLPGSLYRRSSGSRCKQ